MKPSPLGEVFGFPVDNTSTKAERFRNDRLCPFNNRVPSCTKDKATNPLGVCSIIHNDRYVITCPIRFTEDWLISADAAEFFFGTHSTWTSLREVRVNDVRGNSAGNIDYVLVEYDTDGIITDFGAVEVQGVYISGNIRTPFEQYMENRSQPGSFSQENRSSLPSPDYLSSSRKRLIPQLLYKGGIFHSWKKKTAIVLQESFFATMPELPVVHVDAADMVWLLYDLVYIAEEDRYGLTLTRKVYTSFTEAMEIVSHPLHGEVEDFVQALQHKLDSSFGASPDAPILTDLPVE